jgi:hypothetical protein
MSGIVNAPQVWMANMTPAQQALYRMAAGGSRSTARRKRRSTKTKTMRRRKSRPAATAKRRKRGKRARLVKGSAAAKRYMASIRRKRKR